ncbi:MAG: DUF262 domain-containing protein [Bacteroidaceae bacterium]|nr:DUF262 domain-containing protein [Bacteroidaceae bacterium]
MAQELFERVDRQVGNLLDDVMNGRIGLPDLQRPFVWTDAKVRDLFDSMMKGFPVGYVMLWASPTDYVNTNTIGVGDKQFKRPDDLVIDGQQRLTSLLAAIKGVEVMDKSFEPRRIKISFEPLTKEFQVWTKAYERSYQYIADIAEVFKAYDNKELSKFRRALINRMNDGRKRNEQEELTDEEKDTIEDNINSLLSLDNYTIPTLRILSKADEEDVAEIFRRVNSGGQNLNENNFIETLLAVYDNEMHDKIKKFCAESRIPAKGTSYNQIIDVDPSHIIRVAIAFGFHRARMKYGYKLLRGDDLEAGTTSVETREKNMQIFRDSLTRVINLNDWHAFINLFPEAGYLGKDQVRSNYVVVFSYVFYLMGKYEYNVQPLLLRHAITRWIFMATITSFYSSSPESTVERQLADLRSIHHADEFVEFLDNTVKMRMSETYFSVELVKDLTSSSASSPLWFGYVASINVLGTPMLFSNTPQSMYWVVGADGDKKSIDKHHIFPKHYLEEIGIIDDRDRNQLANFTYLDYNTNIDISDDAPALYVERFKAKYGEEEYAKHLENNAIPYGFESLSYFDFLDQRRKLMAEIIKKAYNRLWDNN